jgi:hypothetical protein
MMRQVDEMEEDMQGMEEYGVSTHALALFRVLHYITVIFLTSTRPKWRRKSRMDRKKRSR